MTLATKFVMLFGRSDKTSDLSRSSLSLSGRGGAVVRARASDIVVGGCEFESRLCHLTGHIPDQVMPGPLKPP